MSTRTRLGPFAAYAATTRALTAVEIRLFLREPVAVFFSLGFPLILLLFVGSVGGSEDIGGGVRYIDAYMATMVGVTAANVGVMGMAIHIAENRGRGTLKRYRVSPMPPSGFFVAQFVTALVITAISLVGLAAVTWSVYGIPASVNVWTFLPTTVLAVYVTVSLGILLGGLPLPVRSVQIISAGVFFLMFFSSGAALPRAAFPPWLQTATAVNPLTQLNELLVATYTRTSGISLLAVGALLAFALALNAVSLKTFDWEGRS